MGAAGFGGRAATFEVVGSDGVFVTVVVCGVVVWAAGRVRGTFVNTCVLARRSAARRSLSRFATSANDWDEAGVLTRSSSNTPHRMRVDLSVDSLDGRSMVSPPLPRTHPPASRVVTREAVVLSRRVRRSMTIHAAALERAKGEDRAMVLVGEEPVALLAAQRCVSAAKRELRALVVEAVALEAFEGMTTLAEPLSLRKIWTVPTPGRVMGVLVAGGAQAGYRSESYRLTRAGWKDAVLGTMA